MTTPFGKTLAGPPAEFTKPVHCFTTFPFISITTAAGVPSGERTVKPLHARLGSKIVVPVGNTVWADIVRARANNKNAMAVHAPVRRFMTSLLYFLRAGLYEVRSQIEIGTLSPYSGIPERYCRNPGSV